MVIGYQVHLFGSECSGISAGEHGSSGIGRGLHFSVVAPSESGAHALIQIGSFWAEVIDLKRALVNFNDRIYAYEAVINSVHFRNDARHDNASERAPRALQRLMHDMPRSGGSSVVSGFPHIAGWFSPTVRCGYGEVLPKDRHGHGAVNVYSHSSRFLRTLLSDPAEPMSPHWRFAKALELCFPRPKDFAGALERLGERIMKE